MKSRARDQAGYPARPTHPAARQIWPRHRAVESLVLMGSIGTIAQTDHSDFDYWVCVDGKKFSDESLNLLQQKLTAIESWAEANFGIEVHFFLSDIEKVKRKEINDPVLNFQISNDFHPAKVLKGYLKGDEESGEYAVLLVWNNIYYEKPNKKATTKKKVVRLGLVQWQMRPYKKLEDLLQQAEYFIDTDPGFGNGTAITVDSNTGLLNQTISIPTSPLEGFHNLYIRTLNSENNWSFYDRQSFYLKSFKINPMIIL